LVSDPSEKVVVVPARYEWEYLKKIKVSDGVERLIVQPPQYKTAYEKILVKPAQRVWKTSRSPGSPDASDTCVQSASASGMDIGGAMPGTCYYEHYTPAKYEKITKKILAAEPTEKSYIWFQQNIELFQRKFLYLKGRKSLSKSQHSIKLLKRRY